MQFSNKSLDPLHLHENNLYRLSRAFVEIK